MSVEEATGKEASRIQIAIVGVGGAGNNLLSQAITGGVSPKSCVAVGRSLNQLSSSQAKNKVLLAETIGSDQGSFDGPSSVHLLAHRVSPFTCESDFTILLTGLGGVTGTSAAPTIAQVSRTEVRPVVSIVALPFIHERERRFVALRGLKRMVESCDCTVVVDNASQFRTASGSERAADETAGLAVRELSEAVSVGGPLVAHRILGILSLGRVSVVCTARVSSAAGIQTAVADALRIPSANLPMSKAKGAVMVFRGPEKLSPTQAVRAYEAMTSLVGHDMDFVHVSVKANCSASMLIFLTGYSYGNALEGLVDLIEGLYDLEFGVDSSTVEQRLIVPLYQMERF